MYIIIVLFFLFLLLACVAHGGAMCPFDGGFLGLRPRDPFLFAGVPAQLCCVILNSTVDWPLEDVVFHCQGTTPVNASVIPSVSSNESYARVSASTMFSSVSALKKSCAYVNASVAGVCVCQHPSRKSCQASQFAKIDEPLPSQLDFECINFWNERLICTPKLPAFNHGDNVKTSITWKSRMNPRSKWKSKACLKTSCELNSTDLSKYLLLGFQKSELDISVKVEYHIPIKAGLPSGFQRVESVTSDLITIDLSKYVKLKAIEKNDISTKTNATSITITWERQIIFVPGSKTVNISYTAQESWKSSGNKSVQVLHDTNTATPLPRATLSDLSPYTTYNICLTSKAEFSPFWSDAVCFDASTLSSVPERSPTIFSDAFAILGSSSIIIYWQTLEEWEWNDDSSERRFILQKYQHSSHPSGEKSIYWRDNQTTIDNTKYSYYGLIAANSMGRAKNISFFKVTPKNERISGPKNLKAIYDKTKGMMDISWQAGTNERPVVYWCQQGDQKYSCLNAIQRETLDSGTTSFVANFSRARGIMYGVSLSKRAGHITLRSGINWQTCITVMTDGNATSLLGNCETIQTVEQSKFPTWAIVVVSITVVFLIILCFIYCRYRCHSRAKILKNQQIPFIRPVPQFTSLIPQPPADPPPILRRTDIFSYSNSSGSIRSCVLSDSGNQSDNDSNETQVELSCPNQVNEGEEGNENGGMIGVEEEDTMGSNGIERMNGNDNPAERQEENEKEDDNTNNEDDNTSNEDDNTSNEDDNTSNEDDDDESSEGEEETEWENSACTSSNLVLKPKSEEPVSTYVSVAEESTEESTGETTTKCSSAESLDVKSDKKDILSNCLIPDQQESKV